MATADQYAEWIVRNKDKKGTKEFETVAAAYRLAKDEEAAVTQPAAAPAAPTAAMAEIPQRRGLAASGDRATGFRPAGQSPVMNLEQGLEGLKTAAAIGAGIVAGPALAAGSRALGAALPALQRVTTPLATAFRTGGFQSGLPQTAPAAARLASRVVGAAVPGAIAGGIISPEEAATGAGVSTTVALGAPAGFRLAAKGGGYIADALQGRLADIRANQLVLKTVGDEVNALRQLMAASPDVPASRIAAQHSQELPALQALLAEAESLNPTGVANAFRAAEADEIVNELARIAGGKTSETSRVSQATAKKLLTAKTTPMRQEALSQAAPTSPQPLVSAIDEMMLTPSVRNDEFAQKVLQRVRDKIDKATREGVINPEDLYEIRKSGINNAITELNPGIDAKSRNNYVSGLLGNLRDKLDETMEAAGGESFKKYLKTFEAGMNDIEDTRLANRLRALYEKGTPASKQQIVNLLKGESPEAIQRILKSRRFKLDEILVKDKALLQRIKTDLGLDLEAAKQAKKGVEELARIREGVSANVRFPFFTRMSTAVNAIVESLENKLSRQTMDEIINAAQSGRQFNRILDSLPIKDRNAFLAQFKNAESWSKFTTEIGRASQAYAAAEAAGK